MKEKREEPSARSILYQVREFIRILSLNPDDGQFVFHYSGQDEGKACLQYIALNPALSLKRLLDQAEKVVLASGTLEPTEEYDVLNSYINCGSDHSIIHKFSCGHVLPLDNFKCQLVSQSIRTNSIPFDFRFASRESPQQLQNLATFILDICTISASNGGTVVFL